MKPSRSKESNLEARIPSPLRSKMHSCPHAFESVDAVDDKPLGEYISIAGLPPLSNSDCVETRNTLSESESTQSYKLQSSTGAFFQKTSHECIMQVKLPNHIQVMRIPCKARGMGESHGPQSAFFDIRQETRHGETLVCSHPTCSGSGRRFKYCSMCQCPVAKRNFVKRHSHGQDPPDEFPSTVLVIGQLLKSPPDQVGDEMNSEISSLDREDTAHLRFCRYQKRRRSLTFDAADTLKSLSQASETQFRDCAQEATNGSVTSAPILDTSKHHSVQLSSMEMNWIALLRRRPHENVSAMGRWMEDVINVSEPSSTRSNLTSATPPSLMDSPQVQQGHALNKSDDSVCNHSRQGISTSEFQSSVDRNDQHIPMQGKSYSKRYNFLTGDTPNGGNFKSGDETSVTEV